MNRKNRSYFLVVGLGASGVSMAKFLRSKGETVVATDIDASRADIEQDLNNLGIETEIGFHRQKTFNNAKMIVPSPGIPLTSTYIRKAIDTGVTITGELDIFSQYNTLPVIAITGTNGKTTTTTLVGQMLTACGMTPFVGGNIGTPLVDLLMSKQKNDVIVAEISSFQLDLSRQFRPDVGVLLNISEDHLDRYEDFNAYKASKWQLFKNQGALDKAVINCVLKQEKNTFSDLKAPIFTFSSSPDRLTPCNADISSNNIEISFKGLNHRIATSLLTELQGPHNHENIAAAVLACLALGADFNGILKGLEKFKNLAHRMAFVKTIDNISFYNDSKATNTDAVIRAIECFKQNIILILGGREKGTDFSLLKKDVQKSVKTIIAIGESKNNIKNTFENICPVVEVQTMKDAVQKAFDLAFNAAFKKSTILLSPACASFDMYDNYAHRGNDFVAQVNALENR